MRGGSPRSTSARVAEGATFYDLCQRAMWRFDNGFDTMPMTDAERRTWRLAGIPGDTAWGLPIVRAEPTFHG